MTPGSWLEPSLVRRAQSPDMTRPARVLMVASGLTTARASIAAGVRCHVRVLRTVPQVAYAVALLPALTAAVVVGLVSLGILLMAGFAPDRAQGAALIMAAAAAGSGPTLAALVCARQAGRAACMRATLHMVELSAAVGNAVALVLAVLAFALFPHAPGSTRVAGWSPWSPAAPIWIAALLVVTITAVRLATRHVAGCVVQGPIPGAPGLTASPGWTYGLVSQSMLGLLAALGHVQVWDDAAARIVLAAVVAGSVLNELLAPTLAQRLGDQTVPCSRRRASRWPER